MSLFVIGAGGHAKVVLSTLREAGQAVEGVLDDNPDLKGTCVLGFPVKGRPSEYSGEGHSAILAVGDNYARHRLASNLSFDWASAIHPRAWIDPSVRIGEGTVVFAGVLVQPDTVIGRHSILNTSCSIDHDCSVGDFCHVAPGCHLAGGVTIGLGALIGVGSAIIPGKSVGKWATVGAGGVVLRDVPAGKTVVGCPAK